MKRYLWIVRRFLTGLIARTGIVQWDSDGSEYSFLMGAINVGGKRHPWYLLEENGAGPCIEANFAGDLLENRFLRDNVSSPVAELSEKR